MAITISGENNNDKILASDGVIDQLSGFSIVGVITATSFTGDVTGNLTGNVTGNINNSTLLLQTGSTERVRIDSSGRVMMGTTTEGRVEADDLTIATSGSTGITLRSGAGAAGNLFFSDGTSGDDELRGILQYHHLDNRMSFSTNATRRLTIDSSGRLLLHYDTETRTVGTKTGQLQVINTGNNAAISIIQNNNAASAPFLCFGKTRSGDTTGSTIVQNNDSLGQILFCGADGANVDSIGAWILAQVDGTPGSNDMPGRLIFSTSADGSGTPTERLRIDSSGNVDIATGQLTISNDIKSSDDDFYIYSYKGGSNGQVRSGIQYDGNSQRLRFFTATNERVRITSGGNVGIGTDNPQCILDISKDISGGVNNVDIRNHHATGGAALRIKTQGTYASPTYQAILGASDSGGTIRVGALSNHPLLLLVNNTEKLRITTDGNLIAGRTDGAFTYNDTNLDNTFLELYGGTTAGRRGILSLAGRTGSNNGLLGTIWFVNNNNSGASPGSTMKLAAAIQAASVTNNNNAQNNAGSYLQLMTKSQGGSLLERVRIEATGNTDVKKGLRVSGEDSGWGVGNEGAFMDYYAAGGMVRLGHVNGASGSAKKVVIYTGSLNRLQIDSNGKVGINQSSPVWYLDVKNPNPGNDSKQAIQRWLNEGQNTLELNMYGGTVDQCQFAATNAEQTISFLTGRNTGSQVVSTETTLLMTQNRDIWLQGPGTSVYGGALFIGRSASPYGNLGALRDTNGRPMVYLAGNYPEITMCHEVASNGSHGPTLRFQTYVSSTNTATGSQFTIGTNGPGTVLDIGHGTAGQNANAHNGINNFNGTTRFRVTTSGCQVFGSLSKNSGSFRIDHPLVGLSSTTDLVHSFIEGPQADLIYRGVVDLTDGTATVNVDTAGRMTQGTFEALCTNVSCFTSNETDWTAVKGSVSGNILTITAQDNTSTATVSWMVVGERKDKHMKDTNWTDENGRVITEPLKSS